MNSARLEQLLKFKDETPDDPFVLYALALEYKSTEPERSRRLFDQLLREHPDYLATYYQVAQFKEETDQKGEALKLYKMGIEVAKQQNNQAALRELQAAFNLLMEE